MGEIVTAAPVRTEPSDPFRYGWRIVWKKDEHGQLVQWEQPLTFEEILHPEEGDFVMNHTSHDVDVAYLRDALTRISFRRANTRVLREARVDWGVAGLKPHGPDLVLFEGEQQRDTRSIGTYRPNDHGARPLLVIEVTSPSTRAHDLNTKVNHYHRAGVPFYAIVDYLPEVEMAQAVVIGYRATPQGYLRLPPDERGRLWLEALSIWLAWEEGRTVCYDEQNSRILTDAELDQRLGESESRAEELAQLTEEAIVARQEAEKKAADLADLVARLQAQLDRPAEPG